ncbi:hypothetical protein MC7420_7803 [Coleofasciculus chthonoplastes PCC 7420]|uniref:Uncharacterized protein n=1 Tax=Coleofasciculus chthonoplastes PCC 7420 TaxID=118168 RepID=B4VIZ4_9CYAN|nr:hypothetical protein MC7420_7803 [Coleofasciculus chthonoplastes PCC 7420]
MEDCLETLKATSVPSQKSKSEIFCSLCYSLSIILAFKCEAEFNKRLDLLRFSG